MDAKKRSQIKRILKNKRKFQKANKKQKRNRARVLMIFFPFFLHFRVSCYCGKRGLAMEDLLDTLQLKNVFFIIKK